MLNNDKILAFLRKATIYEINTRQFSGKGDFASVEAHLPRLKQMGVDILWFMPIHPIGEVKRKGSLGSYYCSRDFFDVNPEFGTKADFKKLVDSAHQLGMKIVLDWVANHAAWDNGWVKDHPDYFLRDEAGAFVSPYDWSDVIQINHSNEAAHDAMRSAMLYWVKEFDIDGFRADLAHLTPLHFWIKARKLTEAAKPDLIWLAETEELEYYQAFDIFYAWKWMHQTEAFFKHDQPVSFLTDLLKEQQVTYPAKAKQLYFTTNHDENSWNGTEFEKYGVYANALAVFDFVFPGSVPLIYGGQEIPNHKRLSFFDKDEIVWNEHPELQNFYTQLVAFRKNCTASDTLSWIESQPGLLAFRRGDEPSFIYLFINLGKEQKPVAIPSSDSHSYREVLNNREEKPITTADTISLKPGEYLLLESI